MPLEKAIPILAFLDLGASSAFYRSLGFECNDKWGNYLICSRDNIEIHLWQCDDPEIPKQTGCYVRVTGVKDLYEECQKLGVVHPNGKLEDKPWGIRQFSILDNSGNIIHFGEYLS
jgi:Glyoxalase superfamily protein